MKNMTNILLFIGIVSAGAMQSPQQTVYKNATYHENKSLLSTVGILSRWSYGLPHDTVDTILKQLSQEKYFPYQDIMINGERIWKGLGPDCKSRFKAIYTVLSKKYNRPITVLDIGANNGYFSLQLARFMNAQCVMADTSNRLKDICDYNTDHANQLIYLKKPLSFEDIVHISEKNHFDIALALNVLHHVSEWPSFTDALFNCADSVIIETPPAHDPRLEKKSTIPAIEKTLKSMGGKVIAKTARTKPGYWDDLPVMQSGLSLEVPLLSNTDSTMFYFDNGTQEVATPINVQHLQEHNVVFPH